MAARHAMSRSVTSGALPSTNPAISIPDTPEVNKQIEDHGPTISPQDIAMGILDRLENLEKYERQEVTFLKEYLESPSFVKSIPLVLLSSFSDFDAGSGASTPDDFAISTISGGTRGGLGPLAWVAERQQASRNKLGRHVRKMKTWSEDTKSKRVVDFDLGEDAVEGSPLLLRPPENGARSATKEQKRLEEVCKRLQSKMRPRSVSPIISGKASMKVSFARRGSANVHPMPRKEGKKKTPETPMASVNTEVYGELPHGSTFDGTIVTDLTGDRSFDSFEGLNGWDFDIFREAEITQNRPLQSIGWECLMRHGLVEEFSISKTKGSSFLAATENFYSSREAVFYHNNLHAADVTQTVHSLVYTFGFGAFLSSLQKMSLLLSSMIHDMGHDGFNNAFHIAIRDDLAMTYNDSSVLENYHLSQGCRLLFQNEQTNFLMSLKQDEIVQVRREMINCVLATDMAQHMTHVGVYKGMVDKYGANSEEWIDQGSTAIMETQAMILHAADVGTSSKPLGIADRWAELLREEFYAQGDEEERRNLPVSPLCDRKSKFATSQTGFIQFIVLPVFNLLGMAAPQVQKVVCEQIKENLRIWEGRKSLEGLERTEVHEVSALPCVREVKRFLGRGRVGAVFGCMLHGYSEEIVIKISHSGKAADFKESKMLKKLDHPNILKLIDVFDAPAQGKAALLMEFCSGGTLRNLVHAVAAPAGDLQLSVAARVRCCVDVARAVEHLHTQSIVHRDVNPTNAFLSQPIKHFMLSASAHGSSGLPAVKLGDLGLMREVTDTTPSRTNGPECMTRSVGTPAYMAPEVFEGQDYGTLCDIYSMAIQLHEVLTSKEPYQGTIDLQDPRSGLRVVQGTRPPLDLVPECDQKKEIVDLLTNSWCQVEDRITAAEFRKRLSCILNILILIAEDFSKDNEYTSEWPSESPIEDEVPCKA